MEINKKPQVILLCGTSRSGKSTWCKNFRKNNPNSVIVRADDIRLAYGFRFNTAIEKQVNAVKETMLRALMLEDYDYILVDGTHTHEKSIRDVLKIAPDLSIQTVITDPQICKDRAYACGTPDLIPVIDRMWNQLRNTLKTNCNRFSWDLDWIKDNAQIIMEEVVERLRKEVLEEKAKFERAVK